MSTIAIVTRQPGGAYEGRFKTLTLDHALLITPNAEKTQDGQPDYRVYGAGIEIGAGWNRQSRKSGEDYVSLSLATPEFGPQTLYANLGRLAGSDDPDKFAMIWNPRK